MPVNNSLGAQIALIQMGLAVDALTEAKPESLAAVVIYDSEEKRLHPEDAIERLRAGLGEVLVKLENHRATTTMVEVV